MSDETLRVTLGQHSRAGRGGVNQDFHGAMLPGGALLHGKGIALAVADGIGSSAVSQEASAAAVRGFLDDYYATSAAWSVRRSAQRVLAATNSWLHAHNQRSDARFDKDRGHVCTFSALIVRGREVHLLHVGDSRIYRLHDGALEQLTEDHRIRLSGGESCLGRALGVNAALEIDYRCLAAEPGAVYLLATDGACTGLDARVVHASLAACGGDLDAAAQALVHRAQAQAQAQGSEDDATVQLLRIDALPPGDPHRLHLQREALALTPPLAARMRFEGYTIVRALHESARSHVYLATDDQSGCEVVLKTPSVDLSEDDAYLDRFLLEEWVARRLNNPHVLRPAATQRSRRHLYVAMEYVQGQTLAQWMTDHPRPDLDSVRRIVAQLAAGLAAFHNKEMLHQDLRPENVMIDAAGTVKIIDFASAHVAGLSDAPAGEIAGSLQYTAPEYFVHGPVDERADLFSLAVLSYQMLCGQLPYGLQVTRLRTPAEARRLNYVPLRSLRPELPAWLDAVLRKALHPEAARRQETVSEFAQDLRMPGPQFHRERAPALVQRHPLLFWQLCTLASSLAALGLLGARVLGH